MFLYKYTQFILCLSIMFAIFSSYPLLGEGFNNAEFGNTSYNITGSAAVNITLPYDDALITGVGNYAPASSNETSASDLGFIDTIIGPIIWLAKFVWVVITGIYMLATILIWIGLPPTIAYMIITPLWFAYIWGIAQYLRNFAGKSGE